MTTHQLIALAVLAGFSLYVVLYILGEVAARHVAYHVDRALAPDLPLVPLLAQLYVTAAAEADRDGAEVVAAAERVVREAVL